MSFMARSALHFMTEKAARGYLAEIMPAGIENLKTLAESGRSIFATFISGCSDEKKKKMREELAALLKFGVTIDMILEKAARQQPEIKPIMESMPAYRKAEIERIMAFLKEGNGT